MTGLLSGENWIRDLPEPVRRAVEERMVALDLAAGETLKKAGDAPDGLFQIESGYLRLLGLHHDGRQILILIYREGNTFGETPVVARRPFSHTTVALTPARIRRLPLDQFWELYHRHPEIPESLCRKFASAITKGFTHREIRSTHKLKGQIGSMIANIAEYCGEAEPGGGISFGLPITQTDIAEHLDVTRQAVQREIGSLKEAGLLQKRNGRWHLRSVEALRRL
jgi:CRP/FNR family cyclic AMP-dependent transcriptional regulator